MIGKEMGMAAPEHYPGMGGEGEIGSRSRATLGRGLEPTQSAMKGR